MTEEFGKDIELETDALDEELFDEDIMTFDDEYEELEEEAVAKAAKRKKAEFHIFADREKRRRSKEGKLKGKQICFSHPLEIEVSLAKKLLKQAFAQGAFLTYRAEECDLYVCFENESGARLNSVQQKGIKIYTPEEFEAYLQ